MKNKSAMFCNLLIKITVNKESFPILSYPILNTGVYKGIRGYTGVYKGKPGYTRVYRGIKRYARV